jgi:hypothetical protein
VRTGGRTWRGGPPDLNPRTHGGMIVPFTAAGEDELTVVELGMVTARPRCRNRRQDVGVAQAGSQWSLG